MAVVLAPAIVGLPLLALPATYEPLIFPGLLLALVVGVVGLKVWERPAWGVAAVVMLLAIPWPSTDEGVSVSFTLPDLAATALVGLMMVRVLVVGDRGLLRSWVLLPLAGVLIAGGVATMAAKNPHESLVGLVRYAEIFVVVPIATYLSLETRRDLKLVLGAVLLLGVFEGGLGVYQYFTGTGAEYGESSNRAVGTFGAYGIMGMAQVVSYAILVAAAAFAGLRGRGQAWALLLMGMLALPLVFSFSRGAWIASVLGVVAILALASRKKLMVFVVAGGLVLGASMMTSGEASALIVERFTSIFSATSSPDQSVQDRYALWEAARGMWNDNPFTGVGIKNFAEQRDSYAPLSFSGGSDIADPESGYRRVELLSPHSLYWLLLSEQGLVGGLAFAGYFLSLGIAGVRNLPAMPANSVEKIFGLACVGFLINYLITSIYGDVGGDIEAMNAVLFGGLIWLASGAGTGEKTSEVEEVAHDAH
jgi:O-antigen ligase